MNWLRPKTSLATKILAAIVAAVILTAAGSLGFANISARDAFASYVIRSASVRRQRLVSILEEYYRLNKSWQGVEIVLELSSRRIRGSLMMPPWAQEERLALLDPTGVLLADTEGTQPGVKIPFERWEVIEIRYEGRVAGLVLLGTPEERMALAELYREFTRASTSGALYAAAGVVLLALALGYFIARRTLGPVNELTAAAYEISRGNLTTRVKPQGNDELAVLAKSFNSMSSALEQAERKRRELIADVAHELRTPLTILKSNFEGIKDGVVESTPQTMDMLGSEVERLSKVVSDLHVLALSDSGKLELYKESVDVAQVLAHTLDAFNVMAQARDIRLALDVRHHNLRVYADPSRLGQVLHNLVDNAIRHTAAGGSIMLTAEPAGHANVRICITDTGEGIRQEDLPYIFDRFYRGDKSRSRKTGGSGLGLSIAASIVRAHGGEIRAFSEVGKGTEFVIDLPAETQTSEA